MDQKDYLKRRIHLKKQHIVILKGELADLQKEFESLKKADSPKAEMNSKKSWQ